MSKPFLYYASYLFAASTILLAAEMVQLTNALLINPRSFLLANQTFATLQFQSYGNMTQDACALIQIASSASPNYPDASDIYANGRFAFRVVNGTVSNRTRTFFAFAARSFATEDWFKIWAAYYRNNASAPFLEPMVNATLAGAAPYTAPAVRAAALKGLATIYPVLFMYHEAHAALNGLRLNESRIAAVELADAFFVFYGPPSASCSPPSLFQSIGAKFCTLTRSKKAGRSIHLRSIERAYQIMLRAAPKGNSTNGVAQFEAGRDLLLRSVSFSILQLVVDTARTASRAKSLANYQASIALAKHYYVATEPWVNAKSRGAGRRLKTLLNFLSGKRRKNILGEVKAAVKIYVNAVGAKYEKVINAC